MLTVDDYGGLRIWSTDPAELLEMAGRRIGDVTPEERQRYDDLLGEPTAAEKVGPPR